MKSLNCALLVLVIIGFQSSISAEPVCAKCEIIREKNRNTPPPKYKYYEDYLKAEKGENPKETTDAQKDRPNSP